VSPEVFRDFLIAMVFSYFTFVYFLHMSLFLPSLIQVLNLTHLVPKKLTYLTLLFRRTHQETLSAILFYVLTGF
jgi:hypothetical protein